MKSRQSHDTFRAPWLLLLCAGVVLAMSMGFRHIQGLFLLPMLSDRGWGREAFSLAAGLQTLVWGFGQALTGLIADRIGTSRVIAAGCVLYALGLVIEAVAPTPTLLSIGAGAVIGIALTATTFATVYGGLARIIPPERRGWAQGMAGGIGGFIQFLLVPAAHLGINHIGWSRTLEVMAVGALLCAAAGIAIEDRGAGKAPSSAAGGPAAGAVVRLAMSHSGFWLLNLGFVSCGFQLAFLGVHLPAYLRDAGIDAGAGVNAIAIIALANAVGTFYCGKVGDLYRRKYVLSVLYAIRTLAMIVFVAVPLSHISLYLFAFVMGATWLGTVPLTSGVVAQIFGVRYIGTLFGLVFLGHQLGGFFGAWLGGYAYDATHSYAWMWTISIALGVASVMLNLPIRDSSVETQFQPVAA
jgi:MFS family permease